jgi:hypothetical protein
LFFHGVNGPSAQPFHGGFACAKTPIRRHALLSSRGVPGTCSGVLHEDLGAYVANGADPALVVGAELWIQCWSRDSASAFGDSLSDAVHATICD